MGDLQKDMGLVTIGLYGHAVRDVPEEAG